MLLLLLSFACDRQPQKITALSDYEKYLVPVVQVSKDPTQEEIKFWTNRLHEQKNDAASRAKLAGLYAEQFKVSGQVKFIQRSDSLYQSILHGAGGESVDIYHCLAQNAITQHKFRLAKDYAEKAFAIPDKKATSMMVLADVSLELGDYARANQLLQEFTNKNAFAYRIRHAKVSDKQGDQQTSIVDMEKAYDRIKGNKALAAWTLTNLADMYGHAGRIREAYEGYLSVLRENPTDSYALKGIAWIAFSNDHNTVDSKRILKTLASRKRMPDAYLGLAAIAAEEGNEIEKEASLKMFYEMATEPAYKTMYHKYLATLLAEEFHDPMASIAIAREEIANRPTPQSFDLLAWGYYHEQDFERALEIVEDHVVGQTSEPEAMYHLGMLYARTGNSEQARKYLKAALGSRFELGPSITTKVEQTLNKL